MFQRRQGAASSTPLPTASLAANAAVSDWAACMTSYLDGSSEAAQLPPELERLALQEATSSNITVPVNAPVNPLVQPLMQSMRSADESERHTAVSLLGKLVGAAFGDDGAALGRTVRDGGGIPVLAWMVADPNPELQAQALLVLANLVSSSVDPNAAASKLALLQCGAERVLYSIIHSDDPTVQTLACATLQNLSHSAQWATSMLNHGVQLQLQQLLEHEDEQVVHYASGALQNLSLVLDDAGASPLSVSDEAAAVMARRMLEQELDLFTRKRAARRLARGIHEMPASARARRAKARQSR